VAAAFFDQRTDLPVRVQGGHRVLEHHLHHASERLDLGASKRSDVERVDVHFPFVHRFQRADDAGGGGLS
jgi:hypothetical protein